MTNKERNGSRVRYTVNSFLDLEAKLDRLQFENHGLSTEAFHKEFSAIVERIGKICSQLNSDSRSLRRTHSMTFPDRLTFGKLVTYSEWFVLKLRCRARSSGDWVDYSAARGHLLAHLAEAYAENNRQNLDKNTRQRHRKTSERNIQMAREYLRRRKQNSHQSDSVLKELIGSKEGLKRSASITAIDEGLAQLGHHPK